MKYIYHIRSLLIVMGILLIALTLGDILPKGNLVSPILPSWISDHSTITPLPTPSLELSGWVPPEYEPQVLHTIQSTKGSIRTIMPFWYTLDNSGNILSVPSLLKNEIMDATGAGKFYIIPSITDTSDASGVQLFLNSQKKQQQAIQNLITDAKKYHFAGYDIFWDQLPTGNSEVLISFLHQFHLELAASERILSITIRVPTSNYSDWGSSIGRLWPALTADVDYIHIMIYPEQVPSGPLVTTSQYQRIIRFVSDILPKEKIIIGLPIIVIDSDDTKTIPKTYIDAIPQTAQSTVVWNRDPDTLELTATYSAQKILHTVWREDKKSLMVKEKFAQTYHINKFSYWHLGGEDINIW
jgi:spore germination protein YaaH